MKILNFDKLPGHRTKHRDIRTSAAADQNRTTSGLKTGNDVRESSGEEPKRSEGRLDEITNTWKDVKRALSLLCVKTFSSNAAMLEAPPGSREDLVEAARTPCTPTDLDTMLYGYTNSIYVLDHTPESLPDMDMLQLFASPAGRALVTGDNRSSTTSSRTRGGSSSSTSLSRESSLRGKKSRRASSTVSLPTPPPRQRKSSAELYKEAVEILGLTCSLTDSCRCLDCQSNYFDCDDDCGDARTELAAGTPILLDHALTHPLTCSIQ
ncbi:uncharacterized protein [Venturia canescens]|uniref:uncharacterized protein isoform X2 n=1 Tax=Venturia canescens TaxID=32260 RepID=UPI001C9C3DF1|nr:uncharacterized protein LOC122418047 isoform X2 [Venturia canescens]